MTLAIVAATWNTDLNQSPLQWVFTKSNELSPNESKEIDPSSSFNGKTTLRQRTRGNRANTYRKNLSLPSKVDVSIQFAQMNAKRDWLFCLRRVLKSPFGCNETITMRHDVLRSIFPGLPSDLRGTPYLVSEGGTVDCRIWALPEENFDRDWWRLSRQPSSEVEIAPWQIAYLLRRKWPKNIFPPRWESSSAVYQVLLHRTNAVRCRPLFKRQQNGFFRSHQN